MNKLKKGPHHPMARELKQEEKILMPKCKKRHQRRMRKISKAKSLLPQFMENDSHPAVLPVTLHLVLGTEGESVQILNQETHPFSAELNNASRISLRKQLKLNRPRY